MFCRAIFSKAPSKHDHYTVTWLVFLKQTQAKEAETLWKERESNGEAGREQRWWKQRRAAARPPCRETRTQRSTKELESASPLGLVFKKCLSFISLYCEIWTYIHHGKKEVNGWLRPHLSALAPAVFYGAAQCDRLQSASGRDSRTRSHVNAHFVRLHLNSLASLFCQGLLNQFLFKKLELFKNHTTWC